MKNAPLMILFLLILGLWASGMSSPLEGAPGEQMTVIRAERVITGDGEELAPGEIVIEDGKIVLVGKNLEFPANARVIDASDQTVMAGMILPWTTFGTSPVALSGVNCAWAGNSWVLPGEVEWDKLLELGFVAAVYPPSGSGFPGHGVVLKTSGPDDSRVLLERAFLTVTMISNSRDRRTIGQGFASARKEIEKAKKAKEEWEKKQKEEAEKKEAKKEGEEEAQSKPAVFEAPKIPPDIAPLVDILEKKDESLPLVFHLTSAGGLLHLDSALEDIEEVKDSDRHRSFLLPGGRNGGLHPIVEMLGERKATVIMPPSVTVLPFTIERICIPVALSRAGCKLVTQPTTDNVSGYRSLLVNLSNLVRHGLSREEALASVTRNPAQWLGIDSSHGTIEKGKSADLVFFDRDPLAPGAKVSRTMAGGEMVWERGEQ